MKLIPMIPALALAAAACSSNPEPNTPAPAPTVTQTRAPAPPPKPAFDALGNYDFTTSVEGQTVNGTIEISKKPDGSLGGRVVTDMTGEIPVTSVTVTGMKVDINANMPDGQLTFVMEFKNNDEFTGNWAYSGTSGAFTGKRKA